MTKTKSIPFDKIASEIDYTLQLVMKLNNANLDYKAHFSVNTNNDVEVHLDSKRETVFYLKTVMISMDYNVDWDFMELQWVLNHVIDTNSFREPTDEDFND